MLRLRLYFTSSEHAGRCGVWPDTRVLSDGTIFRDLEGEFFPGRWIGPNRKEIMDDLWRGIESGGWFDRTRVLGKFWSVDDTEETKVGRWSDYFEKRQNLDCSRDRNFSVNERRRTLDFLYYNCDLIKRTSLVSRVGDELGLVA